MRFIRFKIKFLLYYILNKIDMIISKEFFWRYGFLVIKWIDSLGRDIYWVYICFFVLII